MTNWLIIGGTGRIGRHLIKRLVMRGDNVVVASRSVPVNESRWIQGIEFVHSSDKDAGKPSQEKL